MNVLVTGSSGFIGSHMVPELRKSHKVFTYDLKNGQDIRKLHDLDKEFAMSQCEMVVHLAAHTGVKRGEDYPGEYISTIIEGTHNVGKMCEKYNCKLINFSTASVFGNAEPPITEDCVKNPISLYGISKLAAEKICENLTAQAVTIRPFNVYGDNKEFARRDMVFWRWINQIKDSKPITVFKEPVHELNTCRGYTYVYDIINAVQTLIQMYWFWGYEHFNIGGAEAVYIHELIKIFKQNIPNLQIEEVLRPSSDITANYACIDKAKEWLGYDPPRRFKEILSNIIQAEYHGK